jgi:hypothetical protein
MSEATAMYPPAVKEKVIFEIKTLILPTILNLENLVTIGFAILAVIAAAVFSLWNRRISRRGSPVPAPGGSQFPQHLSGRIDHLCADQPTADHLYRWIGPERTLHPPGAYQPRPV